MEYETIDAIADFMYSGDFVEHDIDGDKTDDFLEHHGILGMHWGERRYQDSNGNWTEEGLARRRKGGAREFAENVAKTAKRANKAISTAARKTFNPNSADMDEKIAKAKEKQAIKDKKKELAMLQGKNRKLKDMTDQEVYTEIQSRNNRMALKAMRQEESKVHQGKEFAQSIAGAVSVPVKALASIAGDSVDYGLRTALKTQIDIAARNAKKDAEKQHDLDSRTQSERLKDALQDARNMRDLNDITFQESMRDVRNEQLHNENLYNKQASYLRRSVLDADETGSKMAAERLNRDKQASSGKYNSGNNNNNNKNNNQNNNQNQQSGKKKKKKNNNP